MPEAQGTSGVAARNSVAAPVPRAVVLGVEISLVDLGSATDTVIRWIQCREKHYVAVTGVHGVVEAQDDPGFKSILNRAGLNVADGMPVVWLSRRAGHSQVSRVFGPDFMLHVSQVLGQIKARAFYYGAAPGVAEALARTLEGHYAGLVTAGTYSPPFRALTATEEDEIAARINQARPDIVWVGLSTPAQEKWMARFRPRLEAPILAGVGAAFDYNTGRIKRAPGWMQRSGLEWLYRLIQEPSRLWKRYARNNPLFVYYLLCQWLGRRDFRSR